MLGYVFLGVGICTIALRIPIPLYLGPWDCVDVSDGHLVRVHVSGLGYRRLLHLQHVCVSPMRRGRGVTLKFLFFVLVLGPYSLDRWLSRVIRRRDILMLQHPLIRKLRSPRKSRWS
jgi:hypothetical protein